MTTTSNEETTTKQRKSINLFDDSVCDEFQENFKIIKENKMKLTTISKYLVVKNDNENENNNNNSNASQSTSKSTTTSTNETNKNNKQKVKVNKSSTKKAQKTIKKEISKYFIDQNNSTQSQPPPPTTTATTTHVNNEDIEEFSCPICNENLSLNDDSSRQVHVNKCLDSFSKQKSTTTKNPHTNDTSCEPVEASKSSIIDEKREDKEASVATTDSNNRETTTTATTTNNNNKPPLETTQQKTFHSPIEQNDRKLVDVMLKDGIPNCPICGKILQTLNSRQTHLKKCANLFHIRPESLVELVKKQQEKIRKDLENGFIPSDVHLPKAKQEKKTQQRKQAGRILKLEQPLTKQDEQLQTAIALSNSLSIVVEPQPQLTLKKQKKNEIQSAAAQIFLSTDDEDRRRIVAQNLSIILEDQLVVNNESRSKLRKSKFSDENNYLWTKCSYFTDSNARFYVDLFVKKGYVQVGGQLFAQKENEEKFTNITVLNTQTAYLLADLNNQTQINQTGFNLSTTQLNSSTIAANINSTQLIQQQTQLLETDQSKSTCTVTITNDYNNRSSNNDDFVDDRQETTSILEETLTQQNIESDCLKEDNLVNYCEEDQEMGKYTDVEDVDVISIDSSDSSNDKVERKGADNDGREEILIDDTTNQSTSDIQSIIYDSPLPDPFDAEQVEEDSVKNQQQQNTSASTSSRKRKSDVHDKIENECKLIKLDEENSKLEEKEEEGEEKEKVESKEVLTVDTNSSSSDVKFIQILNNELSKTENSILNETEEDENYNEIWNNFSDNNCFEQPEYFIINDTILQETNNQSLNLQSDSKQENAAPTTTVKIDDEKKEDCDDDDDDIEVVNDVEKNQSENEVCEIDNKINDEINEVPCFDHEYYFIDCPDNFNVLQTFENGISDDNDDKQQQNKQDSDIDASDYDEILKIANSKRPPVFKSPLPKTPVTSRMSKNDEAESDNDAENYQKIIKMANSKKPPIHTSKKTPVANLIASEKQAASASPLTPMPNYVSMNTPNLKDELKRFGVKGLPRKKAVKKLVEIYEYTHRAKLGLIRSKSCSMLSSLPAGTTSKAAAAAAAVDADNEEESTTTTKKSILKKKTTKLKKTTSDIELVRNTQPSGGSLDDFETDEMIITQSQSSSNSLNENELKEKLNEYIRNNVELHTKVLNYEPLDFDQFYTNIKSFFSKYKINNKTLMKVLDEYCITFTLKNVRSRVTKVRSRKKH